MSKIKLDLSQFKHVKSEQGLTTLKHKAGHMLTIANHALSPEGQAQLTQLAKMAETPSQADEAEHKMANGGQPNNPKLAESKKVPPKACMAEGGNTENQTPPSPSPGDPDPDKAKAAVKGVNQPASKTWNEGMDRLMHPSTWMAEGGIADPTTNFVDQNPEAKPSPQESQQMADTMETNPIEQATKISPEQVDKAQDMALGTIGAVKDIGGIQKLAATPETIGPALEETAAKLNQMIKTRGYGDEITQRLAQKLKGLHEMLGQYSGMAEGGKAEEAHTSPEPPASLNANAPNLDEDIAQVPTQNAGMSMSPQQKETFDARQTFKKAHDAAAQAYLDPKLAGLPPGNDADREKYAAEQGLNAIAIQKEDKEAAMLQDKQKQVETSKVNAQLQALGLPPIPGTNLPNAAEPTPEQPTQQNQADLNYAAKPAMKAPGDEGGFDKYEGMIGKGYQEQLKGINQAAEATGQRGDLEQQALQRDMEHKQAAADTFQNSFKELNDERLAHVRDIQEGHIDPEQYWKGVKNPATGQMEGGHSKLLTAIGMLISGWNPAGIQGNGAVDMMKYQMDRNMEAQKLNLGSKNNLLAANLQQFGNLRDATDMTRLMQHDIVANELQQAAAKTASPAAKAAALQTAGQLRMATAPLMQQFAMRRAFMKLANGGDKSGGATEQMLNYMEASGMPQAKEMRERYVPGLGIAATAVPGEVKDRINAYQNVERLMNQSMEFAKQHEYNFNSLNPSERAAGETIRNELMSQIRTAEKQGVYKESEAKFMEKTLGGNPADFFNAVKTQPKLLEMQHMKTNEYHNLLQNLGGNLLKNAQAVHAPVHSAPQRQPTVQGANGKSYTRQIINGKAYMVPVGQ